MGIPHKVDKPTERFLLHLNKQTKLRADVKAYLLLKVRHLLGLCTCG